MNAADQSVQSNPSTQEELSGRSSCEINRLLKVSVERVELVYSLRHLKNYISKYKLITNRVHVYTRHNFLVFLFLRIKIQT